MKDKAYQYYTELPTWAKGLLVVGGAAVAYFTIRSIIKSFQRSQGEKEQIVTVRNFETDLANLRRRGIIPSYPDSQYVAWSSKIKNAFDGCDPFEVAQNSVNQVFRELRNDADFAKLVISWGTKTYDQCGLFTGDVVGDLFYCMRDELDDTEIRNANNILQTKGITYRI